MANVPLDRETGTLMALINIVDEHGRVTEHVAAYVRPNHTLTTEPTGEVVTVVSRTLSHPNVHEHHWHFYGSEGRFKAMHLMLQRAGFPTPPEDALNDKEEAEKSS